MVVLVL
jgi:hypothetical protein